MLILSIRVPKRVQANEDNYERVVVTLPDGSQGVIHFFHSAGKHLKCGFEFPESVGIARGSVLDDVEPEKLAAFVKGLSACAEAIHPICESIRPICETAGPLSESIQRVRELHAAAEEPGRPLSKYFPLTADELNAAPSGGPSA